MKDLLDSLGLDPTVSYRGRNRRMGFAGPMGDVFPDRSYSPDTYGPFTGALQGLQQMAQTYVQQRQESATLDAVADALALELSRYASKGALPEDYAKQFSEFNKQPLERKRALIGQGMFLLSQNQAREEFEVEQSRQNARLFGSLIERIATVTDRWIRNRANEANRRAELRREEEDRRTIAEILRNAGVELPRTESGGISPAAARLAVAVGRGAAQGGDLDEVTATKKAEDLNKRLRGTGRRAVPVPVTQNKWKVEIVPEKSSTPTIDPRAFDTNKNQILDPDEHARYLQASILSNIGGGVYPGMDLRALDEVPGGAVDEDLIESLLERIDTQRLKSDK